MKQNQIVATMMAWSIGVFLTGCGGDPQSDSEPSAAASDALTQESGVASNKDVIELADVKDLSEYMYPPGSGYLMHKSCVHEVPNEARIRHRSDGKVEVVSKAGSAATYDRCAHAMVRVGSASSSVQVPGFNSGWNAWSEAIAPTGPTGHSWFSAIDGDWVVPSNPRSFLVNGLTYLFNSLQSNNEIIQPVLQYGNNGSFGGPYWTFASWHVYSDNGGGGFYSPVRNTSAGHVMHGITSSNHCNSAGLCNWEIDTDDTTSSQSTRMFLSPGTTANTVAEKFDRADQAVLETYNMLSCSQYPASGVTQFYNTSVYQQLPNLMRGIDVYDSCNWSASVGRGMTCSQAVTLNTRGATIKY